MSRLENTSACRLVACGTFILCALFYFCAHAANGSLLDGSSWIRGTSKNASRKAEQTSAHISLTVRQTDEGRGINLPTWCKTSRTHGAWHRLSDDEYKDESPYLRCAFPDGQLGRSSSLQTVHNPSGSQCREVLAIPKVALLFLTRGSMPHDQLWKNWFASIEGQIPTLCTANAVCARGGYEALKDIQQACGPSNTSQSAYGRQMLYTAYVHSPPDAVRLPLSSAFHGRDSMVPSFATTWGDHSTVEAMRTMMAVALQDPNNQRFVTLSETCVPLYSALVVYQQLMHETRSRVSACSSDYGTVKDPAWDRYNKRMTKGKERGRVQEYQWRKHWQFFSLLRTHAEIVSADTEVIDTFAKDCFVGPDPLHPDTEAPVRFCVGDEHYVSTLLAVKNLEWQTDCLGELTFADWNGPDPRHPIEYSEEQIVPELIRSIRNSGEEADLAYKFSQKAFKPIHDFSSSDSSWYLPYPNVRKLRSNFHLFARKFPENTANKLLDLLMKNDREGFKYGIFNSGWGKQTDEEQAYKSDIEIMKTRIARLSELSKIDPNITKMGSITELVRRLENQRTEVSLEEKQVSARNSTDLPSNQNENTTASNQNPQRVAETDGKEIMTSEKQSLGHKIGTKRTRKILHPQKDRASSADPAT